MPTFGPGAPGIMPRAPAGRRTSVPGESANRQTSETPVGGRRVREPCVRRQFHSLRRNTGGARSAPGDHTAGRHGRPPGARDHHRPLRGPYPFRLCSWPPPPGSGRDEPRLATLDRVLHPRRQRWQLCDDRPGPGFALPVRGCAARRTFGRGHRVPENPFVDGARRGQRAVSLPGYNSGDACSVFRLTDRGTGGKRLPPRRVSGSLGQQRAQGGAA